MLRFPSSSRTLSLVAAVIVLSIVCVSLLLSWSSGSYSISAITSYLRPSIRSTVVVGPRQFGPFYYNRGCSSTELLSAVAKARVRPDGASRKIHTADLGDDFPYHSFEPSFDLDSCPPLHIFSPTEACDLLGAYGGLMLSGDSFTRHLTNALFILLSGRNDGAMKADKEQCRGEKTFIDAPAHCRQLTYKYSEEVPEKLCSGNVFIALDEVHGLRDEMTQTAIWDELMLAVPPTLKSRSPIFFESHGIHFHLDSNTVISSYIRPLIARHRDTMPRPVMLWGSIHYPPVNKPQMFVNEQGPVPTASFNAAVEKALEGFSPGPVIGETGTMKQVDWYNATDGAESADGGHYSYQVNLEKALIVLNVLDAVWGEARRGGGLLP